MSKSKAKRTPPPAVKRKARPHTLECVEAGGDKRVCICRAGLPAAKRGRPIDTSLPRARYWLRADPADVAAWEAEASRLGVSLQAWIRLTCNSALK